MLPWISQKPHQVKATSVGTVEFLRLLLHAIEHYRPTTANCKFPLKWEISLQYVARFVNNMSQQPNEENHLLFEWLITI